jgi:NAD(P)H dehydrogenase (quinone)
VAYTSTLQAEAAATIIGATHRATEEYLRERRVPSVLLRNGWYLENYTGQLPLFLRNGAVMGAVGQGRISAASRADYAEAAAVTLTTEGHIGAVYELGGDEAFTPAELAAAISAAAAKQVTYTDLPVGKLAQVLTDAGLPAELADVLADADLGLSRGEMFTGTGERRTYRVWVDRRRAVGRPCNRKKGLPVYIGIGTVVVIVIIVLVVLALRR